MRSIPSLDGIRAVSIAFVIAAHLGVLGTKSDVLGNLGVRVFFVISGFLITSILLKELAATGSIRLRRFYFRRTLRIFPAFYIFLAALAVLAATGAIRLERFDLLRAATYITNYFPWDSQSIYVRHTWSLSNEEQFYLLWPVVLAFAGPRRAGWVAVAVIAIEPFIRLLIMLQNGHAVATIDRRFDCVADALATGCMLACFRSGWSSNARYLNLLSSPAFIVLPVCVLLAGYTNAHPHIYFGISLTFMNLGIALCLDRAIRYPADAIGRVLNSAPLTSIGVISYSLYLWQQLFISEGPQWWHAFPANVVLSFAAAIASFRLVETPFQALKERLSRTAPRVKSESFQ